MAQVASGQAAQLTDTAAAPVTITTPTIQMSLKLDDPTVVANAPLPRLYSEARSLDALAQPCARLSPSPTAKVDTAPARRSCAQPITAPGSSASFDPLPVGALSSAQAAVVTTFVSLAFECVGLPSPPCVRFQDASLCCRQLLSPAQPARNRRRGCCKRALWHHPPRVHHVDRRLLCARGKPLHAGAHWPWPRCVPMARARALRPT